MNRLTSSFVVLLALGTAGATAGCNQNTARPVFAQADWQVRCDSEMGMCAVPLARSVTGENAMSGNTVSCTVSESADARTVNFRAGNAVAGTAFRIEVSGARVPRSGGFAGGSTCSITVVEGANRYTGRCGSSLPTNDQPCQVQVNFGFDETSGYTTADVEVLCDHLPNESTAEQLRSLSSPISATMPADLRFFGCVGQTRD